MLQVNIGDAKKQWSRLLARVEEGEEVIIARAGRPIARLTPVGTMAGERRLGADAGLFRVPDDFDAPLPDAVLASMVGLGEALRRDVGDGVDALRRDREAWDERPRRTEPDPD